MSGASCSSAGPANVVRVRRELLVACMTCPLCHKLLREATTISECLHTFCRKCIYEKLTNEEQDSCPICSTDLGCTPIEKLRPDHNIQDVRSKIFPFKRRMVEAPELIPSISLPIRRKERSLSSLVVNTPRVSAHGGLTRRRTKAAGRKAAALRGLDAGEIKKEEDSEDFPASSNFDETPRDISQSVRENNSTAGTPTDASTKTTANDEEHLADKVELWKPLSCLVEAANRTKPAILSGPHPSMKTEEADFPETKDGPQRSKSREHLRKPKAPDEKKGDLKTRRTNGIRRRRAAASRELEISVTRSLLYETSVKRQRGEVCPIWFSLVSAPDREGDARLPQLSSSYLRIKDGTQPVLLIQKYLAKKLGLASETEVEITCRGQAVTSSLAMHKLIDVWLQTGSSHKAPALTGSSAESFVMVLAYARRITPAAAAAAAAI